MSVLCQTLKKKLAEWHLLFFIFFLCSIFPVPKQDFFFFFLMEERVWVGKISRESKGRPASHDSVDRIAHDLHHLAGISHQQWPQKHSPQPHHRQQKLCSQAHPPPLLHFLFTIPSLSTHCFSSLSLAVWITFSWDTFEVAGRCWFLKSEASPSFTSPSYHSQLSVFTFN